MSFGQVFPARLAACYAAIASIEVDGFRDFGSPQFESLKSLLDNAQPKSEDERKTRATIQFLYRQNPSSFYKFLVNNKLECLVLWTEARCIVRYLGLRGLVYVKWNNVSHSYDVLPHRKAAARQTAVDAPHSSLDRIERTILRQTNAAPADAEEPPLLSLEATEPPSAAPTWASRVAANAD
jgi:hypothetical protein